MAHNYCDNCGEPLEPSYKVCPNCGKHLYPQSRPSQVRSREEGDTFGWAVLGFFFPLIGLILFLVWQNDRPKASTSAGKGALVGFIVRMVFGSYFVT